ncbi:MAG TPA: PAS domain S-box protein [bacterium]
MSSESKDRRSKAQLLAEVERLRLRLEEAEQTLEAIRTGDVDALVVASPRGEQIYSVTGAEHVYRVIVETMNEAALTVDQDGTILFCNQRFCELMRTRIQGALGRKLAIFAARPQAATLRAILRDARTEALQRRVTLLAADGTAVPVQISASPLHAGNTINVCLVASDLTDLEASTSSIRVLREQQQALEESEARFRSIFDSSQDAIVIANDAGTYVQANPAVEAIFGVPPEKIIGRQVSEFVGGDIDFPTIWRDFLAKGSFAGEISLTGVRGRVRCVEAYAVANVQPGRHLSIFHDITERRQAQEKLQAVNEQLQAQREELCAQAEELQAINEELTAREEQLRASNEALSESEERFRTLADNISQLAWMADETGRIFWYNKRWYTYTGTSAHQIWGWGEVHHPDHFLRVTAKLRHCFETGEAWEDVFPLRAADGSYRWFLSRATPIRDGRGIVARWFGTSTDITDQRVAQEALQELNTVLESKVAQRTEELEHRARQLQKLALDLSGAEDRERKRIAEVLHDDVQQILAAAKFHLISIRTRAAHDPSILTTAAQVDRMLSEAIDKSRALSHELSPAMPDSGDLGDALGRLASQTQIKHGLLARVDAFGKVRVQSEALRSFLYKAAQELLFNVVKHARANEAKIRVRRLGRFICLSISDRGRGFDPEKLKATAGLGLFSIRERVDLLGGRMKIRSVEGLGSTFRIVVPDSGIAGTALSKREEPADRAAEATVADGGMQRRLRVLIADDHQIVREGLVSLLCDEGGVHVVGEAANGREAVDLADKLQPDVIIMDVAMPLIDGAEATRQVKRHMPRTRVIALSMYEEHENVEKMLAAGAEAYILKTAPANELLAAVRGNTPSAREQDS